MDEDLAIGLLVLGGLCGGTAFLVLVLLLGSVSARLRRLDQRLAALEEGRRQDLVPAPLLPPAPEPLEAMGFGSASLPPLEPFLTDPGLDDPDPTLDTPPPAPLRAPLPLGRAAKREEAPPPKASVPTRSRPAWTTEQLLVRVGGALGALLLLAGALFGVETAIDAGWLGPEVRVALAAAGGAALWGAGGRAREWQAWLGGAMSGAGVGALFGSLFAATSLYGWIGPSVGTALALCLVAGATADGVRASSRVLAHVAALGALATPVIVTPDDPTPAGLFLWLTAAAAISGAAAAWRRWVDVVIVVGLGLGLFALAGAAGLSGDVVWRALGPTLVALPLVAAASWRSERDPTGVALTLFAMVLPWAGLGAVDALAPWHVVAVGTVGVAVAAGLARQQDASWPVLLAWLPAMVLGVAMAWVVQDLPSTPVVWLLWAGLGVSVLPVLVTPKAHPWALDPWPLVAALPLALVVSDDSTRVVGSAAVLVLAASGLPAVWGLGGSGARLVVAGLAAALALVEPSLDAPGMDFAGLHVAVGLGVAAIASWPGSWATGDASRRALMGAALVPVVLAWPLAVAVEELVDVRWPALAVLAAQAAGVVALGWRRQLALDGVLAGAVGNVAWALAAVALVDAVDDPARSVAIAALALGAAEARRLGHAGSAVAAVALSVPLALHLTIDPTSWALVGEHGVVGVLGTWGVAAGLLGLAAWRGRDDGLDGLLRGLWSGEALMVGFVGVNFVVGAVHARTGGSPWSDPSFLTGALRSVSWGLYGASLLGLGFVTSSRALRLAGFGLVLLGAGKVFAVDLWSLSGIARVLSALGLGATLLGAAFGLQFVLRRSEASTGEDGDGS